ncbi:MAG: lipid A biosynthesis acyltransferase [Desulfuromonas sp.]|nr:MAG: lipid A biosynthesis acyltransferase [Desulfuromonas sp.]
MPKPETTPAGAERWSSRSVGAAWQHRFFYALIRCGGRGIAYLVLRFVVAYYMVLRPDQRRKSEYYLRRRFPDASGFALWRHSYRMSYALGQSLIDRAVVGILGTGSTDVTLHGRDELLALLNEGKGLILLTAHVGCWQAAMSALGYLKKPVHLLMQQDEGDLDRHYFEHRGEESPFRIIDPRGDFGGALEMVGALKRGEVLSVMADRMLGSDRNGVAVDFLGAPIQVPVSPYKIAAATGAPIALLLSAKTGGTSYRLDLAGTIRVPAGLGRKAGEFAPYARQMAVMLEDYVERYPYQFFNFHDMWSEGES